MPVFAFLLFFASPASPPDDAADQLARDLKKMVDVFNIANREAADPVPPDTAFYQGAIPGMLKALDPHSIFFDPGQFDQLKQMQKAKARDSERLSVCFRAASSSFRRWKEPLPQNRG